MKSTSPVEANPLESLRQDHRRASRLVQFLAEQLDGPTVLRAADIDLAEDVFRYMVDFVDRQHHTREQVLMSLLSERDETSRALIAKIDREHDLLDREGAELLETLVNLRGRFATPGSLLAQRLCRYGEILLRHFEGEEKDLFTRAQQVLELDDWIGLHAGDRLGVDPVFGPDVDDRYEVLFETYVNRVREIGIPSSRHATASAAALVDTTAALIGGTKSVISTLHQGSLRLFRANFNEAKKLSRSGSFMEYWKNARNWCSSSLHEANTFSSDVCDSIQRTAHAAVAPLESAWLSELREFKDSHRADPSSSSLRAHLTNLALRATVKRMANSSALNDVGIPEKNIEIPRTVIDRFIPRLADDVEVEKIELSNTFAEVLSISGMAVSRTILFFPGGGFMMAPTQAHRLMAARLARKGRARVVMVHYRLAPEYRFPSGLEDCVEAYRYLLDCGVSPQSMVVIGDSAGGGMALSTLLRIRNDKAPLPAAAILLSPVTDLSYSGDSRSSNSWADPSLTNDERNLIAQIYLGKTSKEDPLASPLFSDLSGLPPLLIQVGSTEILLDDALRVAAKIRAQGGDCECEVWHDMPHDWMLFGMLPEARKALLRILGFMDGALDGTLASSLEPVVGAGDLLPA